VIFFFFGGGGGGTKTPDPRGSHALQGLRRGGCYATVMMMAVVVDGRELDVYV